jgi:hypothetical protein
VQAGFRELPRGLAAGHAAADNGDVAHAATLPCGVLAGLMLATALGGTFVFAGARHMRKRWIGFRRLEQFERSLRAAREAAAQPRTWRVAGDGDGELVALLDIADADARALDACGFMPLGDLVSESIAVRAFADVTGTTCALATVLRTEPDGVRLALRSYGETDVFTTSRGSRNSIAEAPTAHVQVLAGDTAMSALIDRHRAFARGPLVRLADRDALLARIERGRAEHTRWRESLSPDALLDADLRATLGDAQYARFGVWLSRRLRERLPTATLRRV